MLSIVAMSLCRIVDIAPPDFGKYIKPIQGVTDYAHNISTWAPHALDL